jgi:hypothetical protein
MSRIPDPWLVRFGAFVAVGSLIFIAVTSLNATGGGGLYTMQGPEGVLMPKVDPPPVAAQKSKPQIQTPDKFDRIVRFRVPDSEVDPLSFVSLTKGVSATVRNVSPITETTRDQRGKSIVLLMDNSYSMVQVSPVSPWNNKPLPAADREYKRIEAVKALIQVLAPEDRVALAVFPRLNPMPGYRIPRVERPEMIQNFGPPLAIMDSLPKLRGFENSGTPLYRVIGMGLDWLAPEKDRPQVAVVLTDGRDTESTGGIPPDLVEKVKASDVKLIVVALGPAPDLDVLKSLTEDVIPVAESDQLIPTFRRLAEDLKTLTIGHNVEIEIKRDNQAFGDDEEIVMGYRAGKSPKRMTIRIGGELPATPNPQLTTPGKPSPKTKEQPKEIENV